MIELKNVPKKIYLQMTETETFGDFLEHDVTWSEDRINDSDIEYVRVQPDPVKAQMPDALLAAVDRIKELEEKLKADGRRCPMCGKMHNGSHTLCPACESDPHN